MGFSRLSQVADNIQAVNILAKWTPELEVEIEGILTNKPTPTLNWKTFKSFKGRREI